MAEPKPEQLKEELERRILHGLACEWEKALWVLKPADAARLRRPLFSLRDFKDRLGHWDGNNREISLSRSLVYNHSWESVREVLGHELAHQFAAEVLGGWDEPPHGPTFQKACELLRANPRASDTYPPLDERLAHESGLAEDKILVRVKKLLALAESPNRHEAEAAMTKAHELIAKYNLQLIEEERERRFVSVFVGEPALYHPREDYLLTHLLQDFYFVRGIWVPAYVLAKSKMGRVLEISGTVENVKIARYVYEFVGSFIVREWTEYKGARKLNRHRRTDFAVGLLEGFRAKLEQADAVPERHSPGKALVKIEDPQLRRYLRYRYPHTAGISRQATRHDENIRAEGKKIGRKLVIHKGIEERATGEKRLLKK